MKSILLFILILFSTTNYSQTQKDSLNKVVRKRIKDMLERESDNPYYTKKETENEYINENNTFMSVSFEWIGHIIMKTIELGPNQSG